MDHDVDFVMIRPKCPSILDESKMVDMLQWNVDDDNQHNNDDNPFVEKNHQHLILVAEKKKQTEFSTVTHRRKIIEKIDQEKYIPIAQIITKQTSFKLSR